MEATQTPAGIDDSDRHIYQDHRISVPRSYKIYKFGADVVFAIAIVQ